MLQSMTGFGSADFSLGTIKGSVEIKSVNHRYLDLAYFLPSGFMILEEKIRQVLQKKINRGRITVGVKISKKETSSISLNKKTVKAYLEHAKTLRTQFNIDGKLTLAEVISLPGVFQAQETDVSVNVLWPVIEKSLHKALSSLLKMRLREGASIERDLKKQTASMLLQINKIRSREKKLFEENKKNMSLEELESYQKSTDVNEELERLSHHIKELSLLMNVVVPMGKKLDFIAQEMQRETNTIGSKIQDRLVSSSVISMKSKIEKIREQAQNVE